MKQLSSFMVVNVNGGNRIAYTYDVIDEQTGEPQELNKKGSFYVYDSGVLSAIETVRDYIRTNKLAD